MKTQTKKRDPPRSFRSDEDTYKQLQQLRRLFGGVSESEAITRSIEATATGKTPIIVRPLHADLKGVSECLAAAVKFGTELKEARHAPGTGTLFANVRPGASGGSSQTAQNVTIA